MVLTLQFDKNLLRYITLNLQRLFRTVLVWHFKRKKIWKKNVLEFFSKTIFGRPNNSPPRENKEFFSTRGRIIQQIWVNFDKINTPLYHEKFLPLKTSLSIGLEKNPTKFKSVTKIQEHWTIYFLLSNQTKSEESGEGRRILLIFHQYLFKKNNFCIFFKSVE